MNDARTAANAAHRVGSGAGRLMRAWRSLPHERRLAGYAAIGLFLTLFLPWYQETVVVPTGTKHPVVSVSVSGWAAFSFVEAAVLLVAAGVLVLLFQRAEGKAFHVPGGDGGVVTAAGIWTCVLVVWRIFDKQSTSIHGPGADISGIEWGLFVALAGAAFLAYAGTRIRAAHRPEPPLPGEQRPAQSDPNVSPPSRRPGRASTPRPVAAEAPRTPRAAQEARPTRRRRSTVRQTDRAGAQPDALGWKEPGTEWIDGQGRRTQRGAAADPGAQREIVENRGTARGARADGGTTRETTDDPPARRGGRDAADAGRSGGGDRGPQTRADEAPTLHRARDAASAGRDPADDAQTEPLGPSTHAARRIRRRNGS
jgi:hypothetical protein